MMNFDFVPIYQLKDISVATICTSLFSFRSNDKSMSALPKKKEKKKNEWRQGTEIATQLNANQPISHLNSLVSKSVWGLEHSIYIKTVSPHHQLSAYSNWFKLVYGLL